MQAVAIQVAVGAVLSLALAGAIVYLLLTRAPLVFVADKLSVGLFSGADEVTELVSPEDVDERAVDPDAVEAGDAAPGDVTSHGDAGGPADVRRSDEN